MTSICSRISEAEAMFHIPDFGWGHETHRR
jgi:hypothetical protein